MQYVNMLGVFGNIHGYKWVNFTVCPVTTLVPVTCMVTCRIFPVRRNPAGFRHGKSKKKYVVKNYEYENKAIETT